MDDITITRPVTDADEEWLAALRHTFKVPGSPSGPITRLGRIGTTKQPAPKLGGVPPLRPLPCHPTRPII